MKKKLLFWIFISILSTGFYACQENPSPLEGVTIVAEDQINIEAGSYQIPYIIADISDLIKNHGAILTITVKDKSQTLVSVSGSTFTVEPNEVYTVNIKLAIGDDFIEKTIVITAVESSITYVTLTFDTNGGLEGIANQVLLKNDNPVKPIDPVKLGYIFLGWFIDLNETIPFDFDAPLTSNITIYAKWSYIELMEYSVTYDLNGAFQSESIIKVIVSGEKASALDPIPIRSGYVLLGYSLDQDGLVLFDFDTPIESDITLYAIWGISYQTVDLDDLTSLFEHQSSSTMTDYFIEQKQLIKFKYELSLVDGFNSERVSEYGYIYGLTETLNYISSDAIIIRKETNLALTGHVYFEERTESLAADTLYYVRPFIKINDTIIYGDLYNFQTYNVIEEGYALGVSGIVSGGYYETNIKSSQDYPFFGYSVLEGYEIMDNQQLYQSYDDIKKSGFHDVIIKDLTTNDTYLLVYHLTLNKPYINTKFKDAYLNDNDTFMIEMDVLLTHEETFNYPISDAGFLYSKSHPLLFKGMDGVSEVDGNYQSSTNLIISNGTFGFTGQDTYYVRAFVKIGERIDYSNQILIMTYNALTETYQLSHIMQIQSSYSTVDQAYEININSAYKQVFYYEDTLYKNQTLDMLTLNKIGYYLLYNDAFNYIELYTVLGDFGHVEGIIEGGIYESALISVNEINNAFYYEDALGEIYYLGKTTRITKPGSYTLYVYTNNGYESINFTVTG